MALKIEPLSEMAPVAEPASAASAAALPPAIALGLCRTLADQTRFHLFRAVWLAERCVCDLQDCVGGKPQSIVSHHLGILRRAGLVQSRRDGHWVYYRPADGLPPRLQEALTSLLGARREVRAVCPPRASMAEIAPRL